MRGAWLDSLSSKNSNKNSKISKTIQTRSDPSGGGGFNRAARSPQGPGPGAASTNRKSKGDQSKTVQGDQQTATKPHRNMHRKQHPRSENWPQEGRKWHQQWPKYGPKRCPRGFKNDPQAARRTKNRTKTIRAPPWLPRWGGAPPVYPHPMGAILAP